MIGESEKEIETKRFKPTPESLSLMKDMRRMLVEAQQKNPSIRGLGFYGSRTLGVEKETSDIDVIIFRDSDIEERIHANTNTDIKKIKKIFPVQSRIDSHFEGPEFVPVPLTKIVFNLDIAKDKLDDYLQSFLRLVDNLTDHFKKPINDISMLNTDKLNWLFFLSIGDPVYRAREYVFDKLSELQNGNKYFKVMMQLLSYREREIIDKRKLPVYANYPSTVEEARNYFTTKKDLTVPESFSPEIEEYCEHHNIKISIAKVTEKLKRLLF